MPSAPRRVPEDCCGHTEHTGPGQKSSTGGWEWQASTELSTKLGLSPGVGGEGQQWALRLEEEKGRRYKASKPALTKFRALDLHD